MHPRYNAAGAGRVSDRLGWAGRDDYVHLRRLLSTMENIFLIKSCIVCEHRTLKQVRPSSLGCTSLPKTREKIAKRRTKGRQPCSSTEAKEIPTPRMHSFVFFDASKRRLVHLDILCMRAPPQTGVGRPCTHSRMTCIASNITLVHIIHDTSCGWWSSTIVQQCLEHHIHKIIHVLR